MIDNADLAIGGDDLSFQKAGGGQAIAFGEAAEAPT